ncbi:GNAT family N-acetyltransferase [Streptomyces sp. NRRL S-237]|uniref:GNAT family N-acetyltransferase n=1 Tax=Streptomyces sp. NRRL S-237 TaxID=1463895 RepID=UPI0004C7A88F|nr:GNAT family N-acyltransferase [Streptomyces sp. NRRL S-237]
MTIAPLSPSLLPASAPAPAPTAAPVPTVASTAAPATRLAPVRAPAAAPGAPSEGPRYAVRLARDEDEVRAAQRLRHQVFVGELGARLDGPEPGLDADAFDAYCDHLLVVDEETEQVVGTYRLLPPERAAVAGRLYSEGEFDLSALAPIRPDLVEVGRSCVHPDHRNGAVIALIWAGLAHYMDRSGHNWLAGCCSIPLADGGVLAAATRETALTRSLAPEEYRVTPHLPWSPEGIAFPDRMELPPLLRGYLRLGAWVCGEPALDAEFGCADLYVLLSLRRTNPRYLKHFRSLVPGA